MSSEAISTSRRKPLAARKRRRGEFGFVDTLVFLGPILIFILILYGTLAWTVFVSFTDWKTIAANYTLTGFKWYKFLVAQPQFWVDIQNNLKWLILGVVPTVVLAVLLAYLLELAPFPGVESYVRTLILYPVAMSFIVTGTIWSFLYEPNNGVFNTILRLNRDKFAVYLR